MLHGGHPPYSIFPPILLQVDICQRCARLLLHINARFTGFHGYLIAQQGLAAAATATGKGPGTGTEAGHGAASRAGGGGGGWSDGGSAAAGGGGGSPQGGVRGAGAASAVSSAVVIEVGGSHAMRYDSATTKNRLTRESMSYGRGYTARRQATYVGDAGGSLVVMGGTRGTRGATDVVMGAEVSWRWTLQVETARSSAPPRTLSVCFAVNAPPALHPNHALVAPCATCHVGTCPADALPRAAAVHAVGGGGGALLQQRGAAEPVVPPGKQVGANDMSVKLYVSTRRTYVLRQPRNEWATTFQWGDSPLVHLKL